MNKICVAILLGIASWQVGATASLMDGKALLGDCESQSPASFAICLGYLEAAVDTHNTWVGWKDLHAKICVPKGVKPEELRLVVVKYLNDNPKLLHVSGSSLVLNALMGAFPCDESGTH